jgi:hypothetical protein
MKVTDRTSLLIKKKMETETYLKARAETSPVRIASENSDRVPDHHLIPAPVVNHRNRGITVGANQKEVASEFYQSNKAVVIRFCDMYSGSGADPILNLQ